MLEVDDLKAVYSLGTVVRNQRITCCAKAMGKKQALYVTADFDWFDVGYAIGGLILQRCQLEDAFFIGSILEAPVDQLRARGFPVDRILTPPEPEPTPPPVVAPVEASTEVQPATTARTPGGPSATQPAATSGGKESILRQMFPDCDTDYIFNRLGPNPSMNDIRELAEELAQGQYPKTKPEEPPSKTPPKGIEGNRHDDDHQQQQQQLGATNTAKTKPNQSSDPYSLPVPKIPPVSDETKKKFGKRLGKALSGIRNNMPMPGLPTPSQFSGTSVGTGRRGQEQIDDGRPVVPEQDKASQQGLESLLQQTVARSAKVDARGHHSIDRVSTEIPDGLSRNEGGCEVIPGKNLKPFSGQYRNGKSHNGIRVFSARMIPSSEAFLHENNHAVDRFADVLENLCRVYGLNLSSVSIFHDPVGGTIAFNAGRALYFNVRFYYALHYNKVKLRETYGWWYVVMAHELAHHLVSHHNKEHGYYTESYISTYLPKLVTLFAELEEERDSKRIVASKFSK